MADFIAFNAGKTLLANSGLPATCYFLLSTKPCSGTGAHAATDTLGGGVGEISGTGYARQSQSEPTASDGVVSFAQMSWATSSATDWSNAVKSVVLTSSSDGSGVAICAWNLIAGGTARDLSQANTTEQFTPTLTLA